MFFSTAWPKTRVIKRMLNTKYTKKHIISDKFSSEQDSNFSKIFLG